MAVKTINESILTAIADAIRAKLGVQTTYKPSEMATAISQITGNLESKSITVNGVYEPDFGYDGFSDVTVNVPQGITPTGNINITNTQQTDVTAYATAQVVDADLVPANIKKYVDILGVVGTYEGGGGALPPASGVSF